MKSAVRWDLRKQSWYGAESHTCIYSG